VVRDPGSRALQLDGASLTWARWPGAGFPLQWGLPGPAGACVPSTGVSGLRTTPGDHPVDQRGQVRHL